MLAGTCTCANSLDLSFVEVVNLIKLMPSRLILCIPELNNWMAADWPASGRGNSLAAVVTLESC